ncbi:hypothetical protein KCTCHS21_35600 [Cohnella abietis]|uniref:Uncharacterized protein n=2 Tax=Cohnella abietis TaxID=2507935 RepID=A0A3T1D7V0_9BACL|nr:hypothetical protein KCTCHS21_35600 [Cohnella abietis]
MIKEEIIKDGIWVMLMTITFVIFFSKNIKANWKAFILYLLMFTAMRVVTNYIFDQFDI